MTFAEDIRTIARNAIDKYGGNVSLYSYADATKTTNEEGEVTVSDWGTATTIKVVSSNHFGFRRILAMQGEESDISDRGFLVRDDVTIAQRDKLVVSGVTYEVIDLKKIDPIETTLILQRAIVSKNEAY